MRATKWLLMGLTGLALAFNAAADETCNSPYTSKLIKGQEAYVHVWTLGVEGLGDGFDKLVTIDVDPKSKIIRQGGQQRIGRCARRGPSHGIHRRPSLPLGRGAQQ